jgi:hypothetical protein
MQYIIKGGKVIGKNGVSPCPPLASLEANYGAGIVVHDYPEDPFPEVPLAALVADESGVSVAADWRPPVPVPNPIALLTEAVAKNLAASPHDKRFLTQKAIGKQAIAWIKAHPTCSAQEAEDYIMEMILAELPGQPVVPKLYWEHLGVPQGLAMSYLHEAIQRGYVPADTPMSWQSLLVLILATPEEQIAAWLRSL